MSQKIKVVFSTLILQLFFLSSPLSAKPVTEWTPRIISFEQTQGSQSSQVISVKFSKDAHGVVARVVPELQKWVTVFPSSIGDVVKGDVLDITVAINISPDDPVGTFDGVIQLRQLIAGKPEKTIAKPLPVVVTITEAGNNGLPPDPGEAGKQTLLGIDSDNDGVRDDIQRYIYFAYPNEEKTRLALTEVAKQYQILLMQVNDPDAVFNNATKMARHGECLDFIKGEDAADILAALRAEVLNTIDRSAAYINYSDSLAGEIILGRPFADWKNSCTFDVDAIGGAQ